LEPEKVLVIEEWRKLHNEELNNLYSSTNIYSGHQNQKNEMGGACSMYGERKDIYRDLVGKPEG